MSPLDIAALHEPFVDAERAATFLAMPRKMVLRLARNGDLPGLPIGGGVEAEILLKNLLRV